MRFPCSYYTSGNRSPDRFRSLDPDQFLVETAMEVGQSVGIQTHQLQNRGVKIFDMKRFFDGFGTEFVGRSDAGSAFNSTSGHPHGESV